MAEDVAKLLVQVSATTELLRQNMIKAEQAVGDFERDTNRKLKKAETHFDRLGTATARLNSRFAALKSGTAALFGGFAVGAGVATFTRYADSFSKYNAQLKLATAQGGDFGKAQDDVLRISQALRVELAATGTLYATIYRNTRELKASQDDVAAATETISKAFKISGASSDDAANGIRQLSQALASGTLRGDEFNSMMENAPRLAQLLADSLGVPIGKLREMAANGELTSQKLFSAFTDKKYTAALQKEFEALPPTFGDTMTDLDRIFSVVFGKFNEGGQFSKAISDFANGGGGDLAALGASAEAAGKKVKSAFEFLLGQSAQMKRLSIELAEADRILNNNDRINTETREQARAIARGRIYGNNQNRGRSVGDSTDVLFGLGSIRDTKKGGFALPDKKSKKTPDVIRFFTAQDSAASDFGQLIESLQFGIPLAETLGGKLEAIRSTEVDIGGEARALIDAYRESNRLGLLRAQGRNEEADEAEALARVAEEVARIDGLSVEQRAKLLALAQSITIEGIRQRKLAEDRLSLENQLLDAQEADARAAEDGAYNAATRQMEEYKRQGEAANAYLADTFETLFTDGFDGVWRSFKAQGLRALAELLANIISPADGGGGGLAGGLGGLLGGVFKTVFNPNGIPGRATGGPVEAGKPYIVGEKRPELFIPRVPGYIQPSLNGGGGGGVTLTINAPGATAETVMMIRRELANAAPQIVSAARNATVRDMSRQRLP